MFGAGTAAIVSPIKGIRYEDQKKDLVIPLDRDNPDAMSGPLAARLARVLMDIQVGQSFHIYVFFWVKNGVFHELHFSLTFLLSAVR